MKLLFLFVDGLGLRPPATDNPVNPEVCPVLCRLIARHSVPIDACLGVPGLPQSATGQTTMFTGVNASATMGHHCEGFPGPGLRDIINKSNLFLSLKARNLRIRFADAYLIDDVAELATRRFKSVTSVMALTCPETIAITDDLLDGNAVLQDLTHETIQDRYPDIHIILPEEAGENLFNIVNSSDFALFEYFQTDVAGHSCDYLRACATLRTYDRFLAVLIRFAEAAGITIVMTSDHGNVEAIEERGHTLNPVPFIAYGPREAEIRAGVKSLVDVTPAILRAFAL